MDKPKNISLFLRAITAVLLTIGFYGLAIAIAGGLLFLIYAEIVYVERINVRLTLGALIGAGIILWAIFPRVDRFVPPGPKLTNKEFPSLFKEIQNVAQLTYQNMPRDVFLIPDVNAFVAERGGFMGIGSHRVMGIGLGLLKLLNVSEFRSVLAHEFGHYYGGDTSLGPWIYKTRTAIIRTVVNVGQQSALLQAPFVWYAKMFLRITNAISRQQEYSADNLAAQKIGKLATVSGLKKIHRYGNAFGAYWQQEYLPVINSGYRPSLLNGFERFLEAENVTQIIEQGYQKALSQEKSDPYDTHPSLKERLAALEELPEGGVIRDEPSISLIRNIEDMENRILIAIANDKNKINKLKPVEWDNLTETVYLPIWKTNVQTFAGALQGITVGNLPDNASNVSTLFTRIVKNGWKLPQGVKATDVPPQGKLEICNNVIGSSLAVTLHEQGWLITTEIGKDFVLKKDNQEIHPFRIFIELATEKLSKEKWEGICNQCGISEYKLGKSDKNQ